MVLCHVLVSNRGCKFETERLIRQLLQFLRHQVDFAFNTFLQCRNTYVVCEYDNVLQMSNSDAGLHLSLENFFFFFFFFFVTLFVCANV